MAKIAEKQFWEYFIKNSNRLFNPGDKDGILIDIFGKELIDITMIFKKVN